jgi:hypothetical protein
MSRVPIYLEKVSPQYWLFIAPPNLPLLQIQTHFTITFQELKQTTTIFHPQGLPRVSYHFSLRRIHGTLLWLVENR